MTAPVSAMAKLWLGVAIVLSLPAAPAWAQDNTTVTVKGQKSQVKRKVDRTVYDQSDAPAAQSGTAADVLKTVPAVTVSPDGDVALRGDSNVQVYIDGKPSAMMSGEARAATLMSMSGGDIASVEVITNPSAAYNANGGGIINIVLKKNRKPGGNGMARANVADHGLFNVSLNGNYTHGRLSLHGTVGQRRDGVLKQVASELAWRDPVSGASGRSVQASRVFARRASQSASAGLDYQINDRDSFSLSGNYASRRSTNVVNEYQQDYDSDGGLVDDFDRRSQGPNKQADRTVSAIVEHRGAGGDDLKVQVQLSGTDIRRDKSYSNLFAFPVRDPEMDHVFSTSQRRLTEWSLDYARPVGEAAQVSLGYDVQSERADVYNYHALIDGATGAENVLAGGTNRFGFAQVRSAGYVTWQDAFGPWTVLAGGRLEQVTTRLTSVGYDAAERSYAHLNPSLHIAYKIDDQRQFKASLSESLQRPDPRDLNPFVVYVDAQNISSGNPELKAQRVASLEGGYDYSSDRRNWGITAYYRTSAGTVTDDSYFVSDGVLLTTKRNSGAGMSGGMDYTASGHVGQKLSYSTDINIYYAELEAVQYGGVLRQSGLSYSSQASLSYETDTTEMSIEATAQGHSLTSQGSQSGQSAINLSWKRRLSGRVNLIVTANDVLAGSRQTFVSRTATVYRTGYNDLQGRRVWIGVQWRLGG